MDETQDQEGDQKTAGEGEQTAEEEEDLIVDPNDPLYGLEQRLKHTNLDDITKSVIKSRLKNAHAKINDQLDARRENLETKLAPPKKK